MLGFNKNIWLVLVSLIIIGRLQSQPSNDYRLIIGEAPFTSTSENQEKYCKMVSETILDDVRKTKRFRIVDIDGSARKKAQEHAQENAHSENWKDAAAGQDLNATFTLTGSIQSLKFIRINNGQGYKATITITIKIMNTSTGAFINNGTQTFSSQGSEIKLTPENALQSALNTINEAVQKYFLDNFPLQISIAKIQTNKDEKAQTVITYGGNEFGVMANQVYTVFAIDKSLDKTAPLPTEIGKIKITKVVNENYSEAKVIKGGDLIMQKFNNKEEILCKLIQ